MKIRRVMAKKGDIPEYVNKMTQEVFDIWPGEGLEDLKKNRARGSAGHGRYLDELDDTDVKEMSIHRGVSGLNYFRKCAEASAVQAYMEQEASTGSGEGDKLRD